MVHYVLWALFALGIVYEGIAIGRQKVRERKLADAIIADTYRQAAQTNADIERGILPPGY